LRTVDFRQQIRGPVPVGDSPAIVAVDEASLVAFGRWPWPRERIAALVSELTRLGAAAIGLDIVFAEVEPEGDAMLAEAIRKSGKVVLGYFVDLAGRAESVHAADLSEYNLIRPGLGESPGEGVLLAAPRVVGNVPVIASAAAGRAGYFNMLPDGDGIFRRVQLAIRDVSSGEAKRLLVPLPLEILRSVEPNAPLAITFDDNGVASITLGGRSIPVDRHGDLWVNYAGPPRTFPHYSAADVLGGKIDSAAIRDRIIIIGVTATGAYDIRATPFNPAFPGVEVHANVIENILHRRALRHPWWLPAADAGGIILFGLALGAALQRFKGAWGPLFSVAALAVYLAASQRLFAGSDIALSAVYPLLLVFLVYPSVTLLHYFTEARTKRRIRDAFSLYLQPEVARMVSEDPDLLRLGGEKRDLSVLFSDVRDFTSCAENAEPERLVDFMNEYFGAMTEIVFANDGLLDKYVGDAIMALWG
ncbi:MAG: CHASE2 domain-containing protein, partial [Candidatus Binatia bacterium]